MKNAGTKKERLNLRSTQNLTVMPRLNENEDLDMDPLMIGEELND
jgi:hypothetical protein